MMIGSKEGLAMKGILHTSCLSAGWRADKEWSMAKITYECVFSYLYDSMKEFSGAILKLQIAWRRHRFSFMDEPGSFVFCFIWT